MKPNQTLNEDKDSDDPPPMVGGGAQKIFHFLCVRGLKKTLAVIDRGGSSFTCFYMQQFSRFLLLVDTASIFIGD